VHRHSGSLADVAWINLPWRLFPLTGTHTIPDSTLQGWRNEWVASNGLNDPAQAQIANPLPQLVGKAAGPIGQVKLSTLNMQQPYLALLGQTVLGNGGMSNYNSLQIKAERAYSNGLQMMINYTWSKSTGLYGGGLNSSYAESGVASGAVTPAASNYRNLRTTRPLARYPHRFLVVSSYLLPTGKGRALDPGNRVLRALVGDWQLASVVTLQSGQPWGPSCGGMNGRCEIASGEPIELPQELQGWYDGKTAVTLPNGALHSPVPVSGGTPTGTRCHWCSFKRNTRCTSKLGSTSKYAEGLRTGSIT
jgi:hypothetical protein